MRTAGRDGFTLVELLVVLFIIGLAASVVLLAMPDPGGSLRSEAERFAARAKAARDNAIVESRPALLIVDARGYRFARRAGGRWEPAESHPWVDGTEVEAGGTDGPLTRFDSTGLAVPLQVTLRRRERSAEIRIDADGSIHVAR